MDCFSSRKPMKKTEEMDEKISKTNFKRSDSGYPETPQHFKNTCSYKFSSQSLQSVDQRDQVAAKFLISSLCDIPLDLKTGITNTLYYNHEKEIYTFPNELEEKTETKIGFYGREDSAYSTSPEFQDLNVAESENKWQIGSQSDLSHFTRKVEITNIIFQGFANEYSRLLSYIFWPKTCLPNMINNFINAGFFYTSQSDWLQCYVCGVRICDWQSHHIPIIEHARHQPYCPLVTNELENVKHVKCVTRTVETKLIERAEEEKFFMTLMPKNQTVVSKVKRSNSI